MKDLRACAGEGLECGSLLPLSPPASLLAGISIGVHNFRLVSRGENVFTVAPPFRAALAGLKPGAAMNRHALDKQTYFPHATLTSWGEKVETLDQRARWLRLKRQQAAALQSFTSE
jgi:hypothetical protein